MTEREIFFEALEIATPEARAAYLKGACGGDTTLRRKVDELLREHFSDDSLLAGPALEGERATVAEPTTDKASAHMIGRYKLLEKIGEGGFGEVWMADQREPVKRRVALKIIKLGMDSRQIVARFEAERQALAMMDHANIAKIFDAGTTESPLTPSLSSTGGEGAQRAGEGDSHFIGAGRPYFVMELVRGIKITDYCDQNQLPTQERLRLFTLVCHAIQHAHQKGIIHRDIKPSNILVTLHDGVPVPKVIDFGIAKATQQELTDKTVFTHFQQFIGTPAYISPEQAEMSGLDIDTRADIYSLGVLLYELLVGQTPFDAKEMMQGGLDALRRIIREKEPLRPSTKLNTLQADARTTAGKRRQTDVGKLVHQLQGDLDWIVMKCLEKDRTRRYETANGLAADIQRHLANEPVIARPPSAAYKLQKAWRRNKLLFTAGTAIVVTLVLGVIGTTIGLLRAEKQRQAAEQKQIEAEAERQRAKSEQQRANAQAQKASESEQQSRRLLYAADMIQAQQALKVNNLGRARRLLDGHRPKSGEEDLRGWEWRYLWQLTRGSALATLTNESTQGFSVSFSPDGKSLAVGWWDGRVDLWDVPARRWVRALTERELPHPARVTFSPVRNLLAATSGPSAVTQYDLDSGQESILWRVTDPGGWDVRDLAFSQDGSKLIIYAGSNPEAGDAVWIVDVSSARIESRHPAGRSRKEYAHTGAARLSPDNRRMYRVRSDDWNGRIQCIDLRTSQELWQTKSQGEPLMSMDISPDGRVLASATGFIGTNIHIWNTATGELLKQLAGHTASVLDLAFTRDGRHLISAGADQTIRFWDTSTWAETQVLRGHTHEVWAIATSGTAQLIASTGKDGSLMLWRMDRKSAADGYRRLSESLENYDAQPLDHSRVFLLPPGQPPELVDLKRDSPPASLSGIGSSINVLGCFATNLLCVWNVINGPLGTNLLSNGSFSNGLTGWVAEQHNNARASFTRTFDFTNNQPSAKVSVTNADTGWYIQLNYPNLKLAPNLPYTISFAAKATPATNADVAVTQAHPDWLDLGYFRPLSLATHWQWFANTFQPSAGDTNARVNFGSMGDKLSTFWFADVRLQAGTIQTNQILVGELRGAEFVQRAAITLDSGLRPTGLAYNPARRLLAWSEGISSSSVYLASLGSAGRRIELRSDVPGLVPFRFSEDGNYLAAAKEPDTLRVWNVETRQIVATNNQNFSDASRYFSDASRSSWSALACFAANGRVLVVAILHRTRNEIGFYNLARPDQAPRRVPGGFVQESLAVSPNGELVAASSFSGQVLLFEAATGELIKSFDGHIGSAGPIAFSPDGRRLFSTNIGREAVKLWDVGTGQELLTLAGADMYLVKARWSADGNVILAGPPWQAWSAPSWEEIAEAEAKDPPSSDFGGQRKTESKQP
jgi:serine/threonine protein kinase/WD40 repeat protein